jgi:hypothetical protein
MNSNQIQRGDLLGKIVSVILPTLHHVVLPACNGCMRCKEAVNAPHACNPNNNTASPERWLQVLAGAGSRCAVSAAKECVRQQPARKCLPALSAASARASTDHGSTALTHGSPLKSGLHWRCRQSLQRRRRRRLDTAAMTTMPVGACRSPKQLPMGRGRRRRLTLVGASAPLTGACIILCTMQCSGDMQQHEPARICRCLVFRFCPTSWTTT